MPPLPTPLPQVLRYLLSSSPGCLDDSGLGPGIFTFNSILTITHEVRVLGSILQKGKRAQNREVISSRSYSWLSVRVGIWTLVSSGFEPVSFPLGGDASHKFSPGTLSTALGGEKGKGSSTPSADDAGLPEGLCPSLVWDVAFCPWA